MDRIDLWLKVPHVPYEVMQSKATTGLKTDAARELILTARERQRQRFKGLGVITNAAMSAKNVNELIKLDGKTESLLLASAKKLKLSPRSYHRVLKVSRTIADLSDSDQITDSHILEALQYRPQF